MDETGTNTPVAPDLTDVRERVVQLKREIDAKAPADHDHETLTARLDGIEHDLESIRAETEDVRERSLDAGERIDDGFENYRELLERLLERTETIESRLDTLGTTVLAARERNESREQLASLTRTANRGGFEPPTARGVRKRSISGCFSNPSVRTVRWRFRNSSWGVVCSERPPSGANSERTALGAARPPFRVRSGSTFGSRRRDASRESLGASRTTRTVSGVRSRGLEAPLLPAL